MSKRLLSLTILLAVLVLADVLHYVESQAARSLWHWRVPSLSVWLFDGVPVQATYTPSPVKRIQHGRFVWPGGINTNTYSISAVGGSTSVQMIGMGYSGGGSNTDIDSGVALLNSATTVFLQRGGTAAGPITEFDVVEYVGTMIRSLNYNISAPVAVGQPSSGGVGTGLTVDLTKAFATYQGCYVNNLQASQLSNFMVELPNTTQVVVSRNYGTGGYTGSGFQCYVGLVEYR